MQTKIHVNQHNIRANIHVSDEDKKPVITIKDYKQNRYGMQAEILDADGNVVARVVYADGILRKPLSCGARVWIETDLNVRAVGREIVEEVAEMEVCSVAATN